MMKRCSTAWLAFGIVATAAALGVVIAQIVRRVDRAAAVVELTAPAAEPAPEPAAEPDRELVA
jgi:hypothetical protein